MNNNLSRAFSIFLILFAIYSFNGANIDFSYDYSAYYYYNRVIGNLDLRFINQSLSYNLPLPYVNIPPQATFEYGYVLLVISLSYLGFSVTSIYTIMGTASIISRAIIFDKIKTGFLFNLLFSISYITLFEANAIRVGLANSIALLSFLLIYRNHYFYAAILYSCAILMHVQSLIFAITFFSGLIVYYISLRRPKFRIILFLIGLMTTYFLIPIAYIPLGTKADDYLLKTSGATGLNIISSLSLFLTLFSFIFTPKLESISNKNSLIIWSSSLFVFAQSTIFLIFGGSFADIGVRIWQFSFIFFAVSTVALKNEAEMGSIQYKYLYYILSIINIIAAAQVVNVIFRYPLSNFFYPILPYNDISYIVFS